MPIEELIQRDGESVNEFQVRTLLAKENGELDIKWRDIADIFGCNEDNIRRIAKGVKLYDVVLSSRTPEMREPELSDDHIEILKERVRAHDERVSFNRDIRGTARYEQKLDLIETEIKRQGAQKYPAFAPVAMRRSTSDGKVWVVIVLSDWHIGADFFSISGRYNSDIALMRLSEYLGEIKKIINLHGADGAQIVLLGDMISGSIHRSIAVTNREDVVTSLMMVSSYVADFTYHVSKMVSEVHVSSVTGNHSRLGKKDEVTKNERLDRLIPWYVDAKLSHVRNVVVNDPVDPTIDAFEVLGYKFFAVHGDLDPFTEDGVQDIVRLMKERPHAVLYGHKHYPAFLECSGIKAYQSGCLSGTGDDYSLERRFNSAPNQTVLVVNQTGILCPYFIELGHSDEEAELVG